MATGTRDHKRPRALVTVRSSREIDELFRRGARSADDLLTVFVADSPAGLTTGRVAFIAGRKVGNAVARNRSKRVMREAARRAGAPWEGRDVALIARRGLGSAPSSVLDASVRRHLRGLGVS